MSVNTKLEKQAMVALVAALCLSACGNDSAGGLVLTDDAPAEPDAATTLDGVPDASSDAAVDTEPLAEAGAQTLDAAPPPSTQDVLDAATTESEVEPVVDAGATSDAQSSTDVTPPSESDDSLDAGSTTQIEDAGPTSSELPIEASWPSEPSCNYASPPVPFTQSLDAGVDAGADAGGPPAGPHVTLQNSPHWGPYLGDHAGMALYIYTADFPGDCNVEPISTCFDDCLIAWPLFEAGDRELGEGLDDSAFGSFVRSDGVRQSTYYGWPLYYYVRDLVPEDTLGQGKGSVWYLAEQILPNLVVMRAPEELLGIKYLADGRGHSLYAYDGDETGTLSRPPQANCVGDCLLSFTPFSVRSLRAVTKLEPDELSVFIRSDGQQQVSFRGRPLYLSNDDVKSGEMNGLLQTGFQLLEL